MSILYENRLSSGVATGELRGDVPPQILSQMLYGVYLSATMNWAYRRITMNQYNRTALRESHVVLLADATNSSRSKILDKLSRY